MATILLLALIDELWKQLVDALCLAVSFEGVGLENVGFLNWIGHVQKAVHQHFRRLHHHVSLLVVVLGRLISEETGAYGDVLVLADVLNDQGKVRLELFSQVVLLVSDFGACRILVLLT